MMVRSAPALSGIVETGHEPQAPSSDTCTSFVVGVGFDGAGDAEDADVVAVTVCAASESPDGVLPLAGVSRLAD